MGNRTTTGAVVGVLCAVLAGTVIAQDVIPLDRVIKSQRGTVTQKIANTDISIEYGRPVARGRELYGSLVPYGRIWHPGANNATSMTISRDIEVNGKPLPKGSYSLWTIPGPETWTFIFNTVADAFHLNYPGEQRDALRLEVKPETGAHMETLTYYFPVVDGKDATLRFHWGTVIVPLAIKVQ
jgi:hypothetical protein